MPVPGWPQFYFRRKAAGRILLICYLLLLLSGLAFIGTIPGSILLGLAFACHAASIIDIVTSATVALRERVVISAACIAAVGFVVYFPAGRLLSQVVVPRVILRNVPPFADGDVVLYTPTNSLWSGLRAGDVVLYEPRPIAILDRSQHRELHIQGERIDRILAVAGQRIEWNDGRLMVDGNSTSLAPLNPQGCRFRFETTVPAGHFLILPSSIDVLVMTPIDSPQLQTICLVDEGNILGRVFLRQQPLSRIWWVR
jgi:type IV secretory pathway protease TraF